MIVYLLTNKINGKQYVGQTSQTFKKRWGSHGSDAKRNRGPHALIHAFNKYGKDNFEKEILHTCETKDEMDFVETFYIFFFGTKAPNGYNITDGGDGTSGRIGHKASEETRDKLRKRQKHWIGRKHLVESKEKMRRAKLGKSAPWKIGWSHGNGYSYGIKKCRCEECRAWKKLSR